MIVVKVGGSLFDSPALGPALRAFVDSLAPAEVLLVPGGGPVADAVRELDRVHALGEETAHWLALRSLSVTAALVEEAIRNASERRGVSPPVLPTTGGLTPRRSPGKVLDPFTFACEDEARPSALPHTWAVTTDSIAARAASVFRAERLVLLKSVDIPSGTSWEEAAANGWVDAHFPQVVATLACPVEVINFRSRLT